jgi:hypothetical protein
MQFHPRAGLKYDSSDCTMAPASYSVCARHPMVIISNSKTFHLQHDMRVMLYPAVSPSVYHSYRTSHNVFHYEAQQPVFAQMASPKAQKKGRGFEKQVKRYRYLLLACGKEMEELL